MDFNDETPFPESISLYAFKGKRSRKTTIVSTQAGFDQRKSLWVQTLRSYDAGMVARPASQWRLIDDFFESMEGMAIGFLLRDPTDFHVTTADSAVVQITGNIYSLQKKVVLGSKTSYRGIAKVKASSFALYDGGVATGYTLDATTGRVTLGGAPAGVLTWSGDYYVPCRFATDDLDWVLNDRSGGELLISGPSVPIVEIRWPGLLYVPPT